MPIAFAIIGTGITRRLHLILSGSLDWDADTGFRFYVSDPVSEEDIVAANAYFEALAQWSPVEGWLASWEVVYRAVLAQGQPPPWEQDAPEEVATSILDNIERFRTAMARGQMDTTIRLALALGEQTKTAEHKWALEADVLFGRRIRDGARRGGKEHKRDTESKQKRDAARQPAADRLWDQHPTWSKSAVARIVGPMIGEKPNTTRQKIRQPRDRLSPQRKT
jgi:hypothetical protein